MSEQGTITPIRDDEAHKRIDELMKWKSDHLKVHENLDTALETVLDVHSIVTKVAKRIKYWGPVIAAAAVSSGVASGKWGAFFNALFTGHG